MATNVHRGVVILADDEDELRGSLEELLEDEGYLVLSARSGAEALARMRGIFGPAIAIVDLVMPGMDGWQLIQEMRSDEQLAEIPIVVITGRDEVQLPEGANRLFHKPYAVEELLDTVRSLCT
jgi:CheY-like chemotaxis protein